MKKMFNYRWLVMAAVLLIAYSCKKHEDVVTPPSGVTASFQSAIDANNFLKVTFTNFSTHAASVSWDFGDASAKSTDLNPAHIYAVAGTYTVTLVATGADKVTSTKTATIELKDPNVQLKKLTGDVRKSWRLIRDVSTGVYPLQVGPKDHSQIWFALGKDQEIGARPCALNDTWVFTLDGLKMTYETKGDIWQEDTEWTQNGCADTTAAATFTGIGGADLSAWGYGVHTFDYNTTDNTLNAIGTGAFIGLVKAATTTQVATPQASVKYSVIKLTDGATDTLVLETKFDVGTATEGYWRFVLVHYDDPSKEPPIPGSKPATGFTYTVSDHTVTFVNTTTGGATYSWDFGDGSTSTEQNPAPHTYANDGAYDVLLSATNSTGTSTATQTITLSSVALTDALLNGGGTKVWKLKDAIGSFKVGVGPDGGGYYGGDQNLSSARPCLFNDEFIFKSGGIYNYNANADVFIEDYWAQSTTNACVAESTITGAASIWTSNSFTYTFTPATGDALATITLDGLGAFIALPKAHNGGEYGAATIPTSDSPVTYTVLSYASDGTTDTMKITIDITSTNNLGTDAYWTFTLTSPH